MQFTSVLALLSAVAVPALAAPAADPATTNMMASGPQWTVQNFKRTCGGGVCTYDYSVLQNGQATKCNYQVKGSPATRASYNNVQCGPYVISSSWSGQFGDGNGFQTLAVVNGKQIIYPAYTDKQLVSGQVVTPDQSYTPQNLPS
ncbi:hypothetical protein DOTSEDRAFT_43416 [Dothistroma septosporum NZE10]|uniref:Small secreted protein n=1 Tax=Dothistroma septosporum (strain NZE10 / CBS 128990) TaxID=675120 RepID=N1PRD7_DOTSN|nr:hypothetical protein DOTSEDRAFT_43416 [Dothistroma septosporum NZE10]